MKFQVKISLFALAAVGLLSLYPQSSQADTYKTKTVTKTEMKIVPTYSTVMPTDTVIIQHPVERVTTVRQEYVPTVTKRVVSYRTTRPVSRQIAMKPIRQTTTVHKVVEKPIIVEKPVIIQQSPVVVDRVITPAAPVTVTPVYIHSRVFGKPLVEKPNVVEEKVETRTTTTQQTIYP